ncbi:type II toxin-antitoxin system RelE/ParE family toxin [Azospirillum doebereinerae]
MTAYRFTRLAAEDVADILRESRRRFGPQQRDRYGALIARAIAMIVEQPARPGARLRDELLPGLRSFHVELAANRRGAASHALYYLPPDDAGTALVIVRVLHDAMEPARHRLDGLD